MEISPPTSPSWVTKHPVRVRDSLRCFLYLQVFFVTHLHVRTMPILHSCFITGPEISLSSLGNVTTSFLKINYQHPNENSALWQHVKKLFVSRKKNYPYPICCCNYGYGQHFDWQFFLNFAWRWRKDTPWRSPLSFMSRAEVKESGESEVREGCLKYKERLAFSDEVSLAV